MKRNIFLLSLLLHCCFHGNTQNSASITQIILKLKSEASVAKGTESNNMQTGNKKVDAVSNKFHLEKLKKQSTGKQSKQYVYFLRFPVGTDIEQAIQAYNKTGEIEYAEPDFQGSGGGMLEVIPNDQYYSRQWGLKNEGWFPLSFATVGADIDMENAWNIEQGNANIVVAIIDSGAKLDHPEFAGRIWRNPNEISNNGIDDDENGWIDDVKGWDFAYEDNDPSDDFGHGTNVSGIIGANGNNSRGYAGVDWNCKLMILKGLDNMSYGFYSWWASSIYYAVDNGARVINMSLAGPNYSTTLKSAISYAISHDVVVVASMGNYNSNIILYPASIDGVIAVGSTNSNDRRSDPFFWDQTSGSNFGNYISVVAPGNYIYGLDYQSNTNYDNYWGGTSQAAPHVSGLCALLLAQDAGRSPATIKSIIEMTAEDQVGKPSEDTPGWDQYYGHGRINAFRALTFNGGVPVHDLAPLQVSVFPNPANQAFTVTVPEEAREIEVYDSFGKRLIVKPVAGQRSHLFQPLNSGVYFIKITLENQSISQKVVVSK